MFPYSDNPDAYWTGYFTSRPNDKEMTRKGSHFTHAENQLLSTGLWTSGNEELVQEGIEAKSLLLDVMGIN